MKVLVINSGSSSLKYSVYNMTNEQVLAKGLVERIGLETGRITHQCNGDKHISEQAVPNHTEALALVVSAIMDKQHGVISSFDELQAVGHRVVHGGEEFSSSVVIDDKVIAAIEVNSEMAPLHNPPNLLGIRACMDKIPGVPNVAVFDTAFHASMPDYAYMYAIPYKFYERFKIRRYGFHGTSHRYVSLRAAEILKTPLDRLEMVSCHLGSGSSICAVKYGRSVDTSLGFGTLSGIPMGTRTGDIDPCVVTYLQRKLDLDNETLDELLYKQSGMKGVTGYSDMRDVEEHALNHDPASELAMHIMAYSTKKYIAAYAAAMGWLDAIIFTAGIGENDSILRAMALDGLEFMGVEMDELANHAVHRGEEAMISAPNSRVKVLVIPTNEELMIARDTYDVVRENMNKVAVAV